MKIRVSLFFLSVALFLCGAAHNPGALASPFKLEYEQGRISLEGKTSVKSFLEELAVLANIDIYILETFKDSSKTVRFKEFPLNKVLDRLLKGYNYAVVYSGEVDTQKGVFLLDKDKIKGSFKGRDKKSEKALEPSEKKKGLQKMDTRSRKVFKLEKEVQKLENYIESGRADADYERWMKIKKDPRYVRDYKKELSQKKEALNALLNQ